MRDYLVDLDHDPHAQGVTLGNEAAFGVWFWLLGWCLIVGRACSVEQIVCARCLGCSRLIGRTHQLDLQSNFEATFRWVRGVYTKLEITRKMNSYRALEKWRRGAAAAKSVGAAAAATKLLVAPFFKAFCASLAKLFIFQLLGTPIELVSGSKPHHPPNLQASEHGNNIYGGVCGVPTKQNKIPNYKSYAILTIVPFSVNQAEMPLATMFFT
jgi:hypothetical protein